MNEKAGSGSTQTQHHQYRHTGEEVGAWAIIGLTLAVWIMAYAFAVNGWNIVGDRPYEADIATGWQELGTPIEVDVAKRH